MHEFPLMTNFKIDKLNFEIRANLICTNLLISQKATLRMKRGSVVSIKWKHSSSFWMGSSIWPHNAAALSVPKALLGEVMLLKDSYIHTHTCVYTHVHTWAHAGNTGGRFDHWSYRRPLIMTRGTFCYHQGQLVSPLTPDTLSSQAEWHLQNAEVWGLPCSRDNR